MKFSRYFPDLKKIFTLTTFSFLGPFIAVFFTVLFTLLMQFLWKYIDDLVGKGLEWYVIGQLMFYASASFVPLALPLAVLLSSIMTFGKLAETYELVALKAAGISLVRIMVPMITVTLLISGGAFLFANNVIPEANLKFKSLLWDITQQRPAFDIKEGAFYGGIDNYSIRIQKKDKKSQKIEGITIYDHTNSSIYGNDIVLTAKSGEMYTTPDQRWLIINLMDGTRFEELNRQNNGTMSYPASRLHFDSYNMRFDLSVFKLNRTNEELFKDNYQMLNISQLSYYRDSIKNMIVQKRNEVLEFTKPYFSMIRDTAYFFSHNPTLLVDDQPFIMSLPKSERVDVTDRALNTARTLKEIMRVQSDEIKNFLELIRKFEIERQRKFSLSIACLTLFFIGAPLGAIIRKGGLGMPTVVSILMFIIFYVLTIVGEKSAKEGAMNIIVGMWLANIVLLPIGLYLTWRANVDAISFSTDRIVAIFKKLFSHFKRKNENSTAV